VGLVDDENLVMTSSDKRTKASHLDISGTSQDQNSKRLMATKHILCIAGSNRNYNKKPSRQNVPGYLD
jgi:hypothetical protein